MSEKLIQVDTDTLALLTKGLTLLMNSDDECCRDDAAAYLDLLLQLQDDMYEEALEDKLEQEFVRKFGEI